MSRLSYLAVLTVLCLALACTAQAITLPSGGVFTINAPGLYDFGGQTFTGAVDVQASDVVIANLNIDQSTPVAIAGTPAGIYIRNGKSNITIYNCNLTGPGALSGARGVINEVSAISDVTVYRCTISNWSTGVYFQGSSPAAWATGMVVAYSTFVNNNVGVSNDYCDATIAWADFQESLYEAIGIGPGANVTTYSNSYTVATMDKVNNYGGFLYEANFLMLSRNSASEYVQPGKTIEVALMQSQMTAAPIMNSFEAHILCSSNLAFGSSYSTLYSPYTLKLYDDVSSNAIELQYGQYNPALVANVDAVLANMGCTVDPNAEDGFAKIGFDAVSGSVFVGFDPTLGAAGEEVTLPAGLVPAIVCIDGTDPLITAPANIDTVTDPGESYATVALGTPTTSDNLSGVASVTNNALTVFPVGTTTVTWTVVDKAGNEASATQTVTVVDNEDPEITCPGNITVNTDSGKNYATINLGNNVSIDGQILAGEYAGAQEYPLMYSGSEVGRVYVMKDKTNLYMAFNVTGDSTDSRVVGNSNGNDSISVNLGKNGEINQYCFATSYTAQVWPQVGCKSSGTIDGWQSMWSTGGLNNGQPLPMGISAKTTYNPTRVTEWQIPLSLLDCSAGDTLTIGGSVLVPGGTSTKYPNGLNWYNASTFGTASAVATIADGIIATDNCGIASVVGVRDDGRALNAPYYLDDAGNTGHITITWTVTDYSGNTDTCTQNVTVIDNEKPVVTKGALATTCFASDNAAKTAALNATTASDNSGFFNVAATAYGEGRATVVVTATDPSGNSTSVSYYVRIDGTAPVLNIPENITVNADAGKTYATLDSGMATATDNTSVAHFEGFEDENWNQNPSTWQTYNSSIQRAQSGTNGFTAKSGSYYGLIEPVQGARTGAFTRLGGYWSAFEGGFKTSVAVYIDLSDPAVAAKTYGWDLSSAASKKDGNHLRDFIFHVAADDNSNEGMVLVSGSNNSNNTTKRNDLENQPHHVIEASGWYTFEWNFRDDNNALAVDLILRDAAGVELWRMTRSTTADVIDTIVGGNRYMWFTFVSTDKLAIDDTQLVANSPVVTNTGYNATQYPIGTTNVVWTATDLCGNTTSQTQTITVNNLNTVNVNLTLEGVNASLARTIKFQLGGDGTGSNTCNPAVAVSFTAGTGTASFDIPAAVQQLDGSYKAINWSCITAKDEQHTLRAKGSLAVSGKNYVGTPITLLGGDLTNDNIVDIRDFGVFAGQYNTSPALTTTWPTRNANINCSPSSDDPRLYGVGTDDFAFLSGRFLSKGEDLCGGTAVQAKPMSSISVYALVLYSGLANATAADVNNDKIVDQTDVQLFVQKYMAPKRGR